MKHKKVNSLFKNPTYQNNLFSEISNVWNSMMKFIKKKEEVIEFFF